MAARQIHVYIQVRWKHCIVYRIRQMVEQENICYRISMKIPIDGSVSFTSCFDCLDQLLRSVHTPRYLPCDVVRYHIQVQILT